MKVSASLLTAVLLVACVKEVSAPVPNKRPEVEVKLDTVLVETTFKAKLGASLSSVWNGDVSIYDNVAKHEANVFKTTSSDGVSAVLSGQSYDPSDMYYALYPSAAFESFSEGHAVRTVPAEQKVCRTDESEALPVTPQVAFAQALETSLAFRPVASYLKFNMVAEDVKSLKLTSLDDKVIAGASSVDVFSRDVVGNGSVFSPKVTAPVLKEAVTAFTDAHLSWDTIESADGYKVYVNGVLAGDVKECSYTAKELPQGAECSLKVEAYNDYSSASSTVEVKTKGLRKNDVSTGTTFLCIDWDAICRTRNDGYEQAYQVQIFEDEACTKLVYDFVPYDGQKLPYPCFGNSSYFGHTSQLQDGIECVNYLTPTRVSIGGLYPATTYYVRIRTLKSISMKNGLGKANVTLTNAFGTSEWSQPVAMATDNERTLDERTVFYTGFNDFCVQSDYKAWAPGAVPAGSIAGTALGGCWIPWNHPNRNKSIGFAFYPHGEGQHQTNTWNFTTDGKHVDGTSGNVTGGYLVGRAKGSVNAITGDVAGWIFGRWSRPFMGMVGLDGAPTIVSTPAIPAGRVDEAGSECTISFSAVARVRPQDNYSGTLQVNVWRAESKKWETVGIVSSDALLPYTPGASVSEYKCDFTGHVHIFKTTLKPGDAVELRSTKAGIILVDDFTVTRGNNIDGVSRGDVNW